MRRLLVAAVAASALVFAGASLAGSSTYAVWSSWAPGQGGGSSFSSSWFQNGFYKPSGFLGTVTFIDSATYSWHVTTRNDLPWTSTHWLTSQVKKAHCVANAYGGYGACTVYS